MEIFVNYMKYEDFLNDKGPWTHHINYLPDGNSNGHLYILWRVVDWADIYMVVI